MHFYSRVIDKMPSNITYDKNVSPRLYRILQITALDFVEADPVLWLSSKCKRKTYLLTVDEIMGSPYHDHIMVRIRFLLDGFVMPYCAWWKNKLWSYFTSFDDDNPASDDTFIKLYAAELAPKNKDWLLLTSYTSEYS